MKKARAVVPKISIQDAVKQKINSSLNEYILGKNRDSLFLTQTPQAFDLKEIYVESKTVTNACRDYLKRQFEVIEEYLEDKNCIMEEGFGICDIFLISCLDWAIFYEFELTENITKYRDYIINRPAYIIAMEINYSC